MENLFRHHIRVERDGEWLRPARLTARQEEESRRREPFYLRAICGGGISIGFCSEAKTVTLAYKITENVRDYAYVDIVVDGVLAKTVNLEEKEGELTLEIPGAGMRETEIFLPHLAQLWFRKIQPDAPYAPIPEKEKLWVFIGDSITHGMQTEHPSMTYPVLSSRILGCDYVNMGVCGGTFYADDIDSCGKTPDILSVAYGTNDWKQAKDKESFRRQAADTIARITETFSCKNMYAILPLWRKDSGEVYGGMTFAEMHAVLREEYEKYPFITVLDGTTLVPPMPDFFHDGVHPVTAGFLHFAMELTKHINK